MCHTDLSRLQWVAQPSYPALFTQTQVALSDRSHDGMVNLMWQIVRDWKAYNKRSLAR